MAVVPFSVIALGSTDQIPKGVKVVKWTGLDTGDTATGYSAPQFSGKSVQMDADGTASVTMQGTLMPTGAVATATWGNLHSVDGSTATTADGAIMQILEDCYQLRPDVTTGSDVDVYLMVTTSARG